MVHSLSFLILFEEVWVEFADSFFEGERGLSHHCSSILNFVEGVHSFGVDGNQIILPLHPVFDQILKLLHLNLHDDVILVRIELLDLSFHAAVRGYLFVDDVFEKCRVLEDICTVSASRLIAGVPRILSLLTFVINFKKPKLIHFFGLLVL